MVSQLALSFLFSLLISVVFHKRGSLSQSGVAGAVIIGTSIFGFGGWIWGTLLGIFFVSSSLLSHFKEDEKYKVAADKFDKGHQRDFGQTMANGGLGTAVAILSYFLPSPLWFPFFIGIMATVNADTWATELGTLSKQPPRLITSLKQVERGTSGGISPLGTAVSLLGGLIIGLAAGILDPALLWWKGLLMGGMGGLLGSLFDSLLGATAQAIYYSDHFQKETEQKVDKAGHPTRHIRGWRWLNNDLVNAIASLVGGGVGAVLGLL